MSETTTTLHVAEAILEQLGGNAFSRMIGMRSCVGGENFVQFKLMRNAMKVTCVRIELAADDTYTVKTYTGRTYRDQETVDGIYADRLRATFERMTGLATVMPRVFRRARR